MVVIVLALSLTSGLAFSKEEYIVEVDSRINCCNDINHSCSVHLILQPGRYVFCPLDGAMSRWGDDETAAGQGEKGAWEWFVYIDAGAERPYPLGTQVRYLTPQEAFSVAQTAKQMITITEPTQVKLWVKDWYQGKDYCEDNRGKLKVLISRQ